MHYTFLKNIAENILATQKCMQCQSLANDQGLQITGISSRGMDVHIVCPICQTHAQIAVEIQSHIPLNMFKNTEGPANHPDRIKDEDIIKIYEGLQTIKSVEDLMK